MQVLLFTYSALLTIAIMCLAVIYLKHYFQSKYGKARFAISAQIFAISMLTFALTAFMADPVKSITAALRQIYPFMPIISFGISGIELFAVCTVIFAFLLWSERVFNKWDVTNHSPNADKYIEAKSIPFLEAFRGLIHERRANPLFTSRSAIGLADTVQVTDAEQFLRKISWSDAMRFIIVDKFNMIGAATTYSALNNSFVDSKQGIEVFLIQTSNHLLPSHIERLASHMQSVKKRTSSFQFYGIYRLGLHPPEARTLEVQWTAEADLFSPRVCMGEYIQRLEGFLARGVASINLPLNRMLIQISCLANGVAHASVQQFMIDWMHKPGEVKLVSLTGDYGQGKTTTLVAATHALLAEGLAGGPIPIFMRLSGVDILGRSVQGLLGEWMIENHVSTEVFLYALNSGRAIIILDGFDEIDLRGRADKIIPAFDKLYSLSEVYPVRLVFSGRSKFFDTVEERRNALREERASTANVQLEFLREDQVTELFSKINPESLADFSDFLRDSESRFRDLIRRPIILVQLAVLWTGIRQQLLDRGSFPSVVLRRFIDYIFEREFLESEEKRRSAFLSEGEVRFLTYYVAVLVGNRNKTTASEVQALIDVFAPTVDASITTAYRYNEIQEGTSIPERYTGSDQWQRLCLRDFISRGILERDVVDAGKIHFSHKSFAEYLRAEICVWQLFGFGADHRIARVLGAVTLRDLPFGRLIAGKEEVEFAADILAEALKPAIASGSILMARDVLRPRGGNRTVNWVLLFMRVATGMRQAATGFKWHAWSVAAYVAEHVLSLVNYPLDDPGGVRILDVELHTCLKFLAAARLQASASVFSNPELVSKALEHGFRDDASDNHGFWRSFLDLRTPFQEYSFLHCVKLFFETGQARQGADIRISDFDLQQ